MPMNYVPHFESRNSNLPNSLNAIIYVVSAKLTLCLNMSKYSIARSLADIEGFAITRIDESIDVVPELFDNLGCKAKGVLVGIHFATF